MPLSGQTWDPLFADRSPFFSVFEPILGQLRGRIEWPSVDELSAIWEQERQTRAPELRPLRFALTPPKSRRARRTQIELAELYDGRIELRREVPCLPASFHDLFNAIIFSAFPRSKSKLHERQYQALLGWLPTDSAQLPSKRTREQDALTLFDEGGSVVVLLERDWQRLCQENTSLSLHRGEAEPPFVPLLFGHALLEHLHAGRSQIRSSARVLPVPELPSPAALLDQVDHWLSARLSDPQAFCEPDADAVLEIFPDQRVLLRPCDPNRRRQAQLACAPQVEK